MIKFIKECGISVKLSILGDGPNWKIIETEIEAHSLENDITLLGNVSNPEQFLWESDVYVHPAIYEPFGLVMIEAMAAVCL